MLHAKAMSFDLDRFIHDCLAARKDDPSPRAVREVVARAVSEPASVRRVLGAREHARVEKLHHSSELTVLNVVWAPRMVIMPHNHRMWAIIGIYDGREDNIFWRRLKDDGGGKIEAAGARALSEKDVVALGREIVHSVANPLSRFTGALHVYGGDFFSTERSEWDPESLLERRYDVEKAMRIFEEANASLR